MTARLSRIDSSVSGHIGDVGADQQRRGKHGPHAEVSAVLLGGHAAVADFQHVGIVPVAGTGIALEAGHQVDDLHDAVAAPLALLQSQQS